MTTNYICYETNQTMTKDAWHDYYNENINKNEYPEFTIWWADMMKSGVLEEINTLDSIASYITLLADGCIECGISVDIESLAFNCNVSEAYIETNQQEICRLVDRHPNVAEIYYNGDDKAFEVTFYTDCCSMAEN